MHNRIVTENQLDEWVRGNSREAQGLIVELVWRLVVAASSPKPNERRFPLGDSIGQPGPDGVLNTDFGFDPFVPVGRSFWEIGTGEKAGAKATSDYKELTDATPSDVRAESTFIFVTPLSGRRDWPHTWKQGSQARWLKDRRNRNEWREVRAIDGSGLIDWLHYFPAVEHWLATAMGLPVHQMQTPEQRWVELRTIGDPPPLTPHVFLSNRQAACEKLKEVFSGTTLQLKLDTRFPDQVADFVTAYVAGMDEDARVNAVSRCLIISGVDAWNAITALREPHILIADFALDEADSAGTKLLEKARRARHTVIFGGMPGGIPHPHRVSIPSPKSYQIEEALVKAGYKEERARILAQKSDGNLGALLRCLQNLSLMPEWAQGTYAAELAIAQLLGAWNENSPADKAVVENLSGNSYGEWIGKMREVALRPGTPLIQRDGVWKIVSRYEGWYALGPRLFDEHLDRLKGAAVSVLREQNPKFELPHEERYAASIRDKVLRHSHMLRKGLAESLALVGSHPKALISCSFGKADATVALAVREILAEADWVQWASLNDLLPLLAEAAPREFLDAVENALNNDPCPFDTVFAQEGSGIMGSNYMTGLLWALETLAWDAEYLTRVVVILGEIAARDPGGNWANRPANSLSTILLPWLPQTCAPLPKRRAAVETLLKEHLEVAWKLLLNLLPSSHQVSLYSRKPAWREMIADDWSEGVTHREYWEQITAYADLAIRAGKNDLAKLSDLIDRFKDLPRPERQQLLAHLSSDAVVSLPQADRLRLWTALVDLVANHTKFADAQWAMPPEAVNEVAAVADRLAPDAPNYRHQRLFREHDFAFYLLDDYLDERRQGAVAEVLATGGVEGILEFAKAVESSWRVGVACGAMTAYGIDGEVLPSLLESTTSALAQFAGGFVRGRFRGLGWPWVDQIDTAQWTPSQKGQLFAYLPFTVDTWERVARLLEEDESPYWSKTTANPYNADKGLELAIDRLVEHGRTHAAIQCLKRMRHGKQAWDSQRAVRVLQAVLHSSEGTHAMDEYAIVDIIQALQDDPHTKPDNLWQIEWAFLPLLDRHHNAFPKLLEQRLADDPAFFCEIIRTVFPSTKKQYPVEEPTEQQQNIVGNAYRLLSRWKTPPGSQPEGAYDSKALPAWFEAVKAACSESGHLEIALSKVGHILIYTPPDPDGLWLHHAAATILNARDTGDMRDGFRIALFNARGVHEVDPKGRTERDLATKYRGQAEHLESRGYHRLANTLRELAASYDCDVERLASRDLFDD